MKVDVELKCGRKLVFEDIDTYMVDQGILRLQQGTNNTILFNWDEVVYVSMPEELKVSEYKSTLGGKG